MTKTEALAKLKEICKNKETTCDLESKRCSNCEIQVAIKCIEKCMILTPRWKTFKSNKEFWNEVDKFVHDENNFGKGLDALTNYLMEEVDISEND